MHTLFSTEILNRSPWPRRWMLLGVFALALGGIFSIVMVSARAPQFKIFTHLFDMSLVVHVDLSVLVWFLAIGGVLIAYFTNSCTKVLPFFQGGAFWCTALGTLLIALSPFGQWEVIKSNYIPVLDNPLFLTGLALLLAGMVILVIPSLLRLPQSTPDARGTIERAIHYGALILAIALLCFILTAEYIPGDFPRAYHFEMLFWAGGHVLQFAYTQFAMIGWIVLLAALGFPAVGRGRLLLEWAFPIGLVAALLCLPPFVLYAVDDPAFREFYTRSMIHTGGVAPLLVGGYVVWVLSRIGLPTRELRGHYVILVASLALFALGGVIGYMIQGQNTIIPAHYHGSIVSVTLALMGVIYVLLPQWGYQPVAHTRLALWQPILYGVGQAVHAIALAVSGGYGVLRKAPNAELTSEAKFYMGIMGFGGMLAIIGGILFVVVVIRAVRAGKLAQR